MGFKYFSHNGEVLPVEKAVVPLSRVEYSYGFGVYESVRLAKAKLFFLEEHCARLMESAKIIGLEHDFTPGFVKKSVEELVQRSAVDVCNIKVLLIGGRAAAEATLDIMCLNPLFPDRQLYRDGAACITFEYEREYPQAKTLNMLSSYLAFRRAQVSGAYDTLLVNRSGCITEGTRTNFFGLKGRRIISPPSEQLLPGVTRANMFKAAEASGFSVEEQDLPLDSLKELDSVFLTSTSSKILPVNRINDQTFEISSDLQQLMLAFNDYLEAV